MNTKNTQGKQEIWMVIGIDDLEGSIFAQCSTEEAAKRAKVLLETNGRQLPRPMADALEVGACKSSS